MSDKEVSLSSATELEAEATKPDSKNHNAGSKDDEPASEKSEENAEDSEPVFSTNGEAIDVSNPPVKESIASNPALSPNKEETKETTSAVYTSVQEFLTRDSASSTNEKEVKEMTSALYTSVQDLLTRGPALSSKEGEAKDYLPALVTTVKELVAIDPLSSCNRKEAKERETDIEKAKERETDIEKAKEREPDIKEAGGFALTKNQKRSEANDSSSSEDEVNSKEHGPEESGSSDLEQEEKPNEDKIIPALSDATDTAKPQHCPLIVNTTEVPLIVYQSFRGSVFNKQCLRPNEALSIPYSGKNNQVVKFYLHAEVGDEKSLPGKLRNLQNVATAAVVPFAFCVGALAAAVSAGTLIGPSVALAPIVSGLVVNGVTIDTAAIAAGVKAAGGVKAVIEKVMKKRKKNFHTQLWVKQREDPKVFIIKGGMSENLMLVEVKDKQDDHERIMSNLDTMVVKDPIP